MISTATTPPRNLLEVTDLRVAAGSRGAPIEIVHGVTLSVAANEIVGILGESGSGKSTLCRALADVLPQGIAITGGSVKLEDARNGIGFVFQEPLAALNPVMSIGDQIIEASRVHDARRVGTLRQEAIELLESVGIPDPRASYRKYPHQFSGGQRQRIVLAIALASNPGVIVADEPTSALDLSTQVEILELIETIVQERGLGMIIVSHDLGVLNRICDRVAVMYGGLIVEAAETNAVLRETRHPYTQALLRARPSITDRVTRLQTVPGRPITAGAMDGGCPFRPRCDYAQDECRHAGTQLEPVGTGHLTACIRTREIWGNDIEDRSGSTRRSQGS